MLGMQRSAGRGVSGVRPHGPHVSVPLRLPARAEPALRRPQPRQQLFPVASAAAAEQPSDDCHSFFTAWRAYLMRFKKVQLQNLATEKRLPRSGTKAEIVNRILAKEKAKEEAERSGFMSERPQREPDDRGLKRLLEATQGRLQQWLPMALTKHMSLGDCSSDMTKLVEWLCDYLERRYPGLKRMKGCSIKLYKEGGEKFICPKKADVRFFACANLDTKASEGAVWVARRTTTGDFLRDPLDQGVLYSCDRRLSSDEWSHTLMSTSSPAGVVVLMLDFTYNWTATATASDC